VDFARIVQNSLSRGRLSGVNIRQKTEVSGVFKRKLSSHLSNTPLARRFARKTNTVKQITKINYQR
jgi:hypothetical protein